MNSEIRVRFAPSPTGPLHIGGIRTALFNYLFAKNRNGTFLLRIEDTDTERSRPEYEEEIRSSLAWLGFDWEREVLKQSARLSIYQNYAKLLKEEGKAYEFEGALKFQMPKKKVAFQDLVHGKVEFDSALFDDLVIMKSNGFPTYNFACVIDDHESGMTHLIRGDDHLSNTPRQILLYEAFGWRLPQFAHLPLVFGNDGEPLSKRNGEVNLQYYRKKGFIPDGIINYLALLGWSAGGNQEFFPRSELIKQFSVKKIHNTNATFDLEKMKWLNGEHLKMMSNEDFVSLGKNYLKENGISVSEGLAEQVLLLYKPRTRILEDLLWQAECFWKEEVHFDPEAVSKYLAAKETFGYIASLRMELSKLQSFSDEKQIEEVLRQSADRLKIQAKELIHPCRVALTGRSVSPGIFEVMKLMGKETVLKRLQNASELF